MNKKVILLLLVSFFLATGFTSEYNLEVDENLEETVNINILKEDFENPNTKAPYLLNATQNAIMDDEKPKPYDKKIKEQPEFTNITLKYTYTPEEFEKANYASTCFQGHTYLKKNNYIYFDGFGEFYCLTGKEVKITVTTDKLVMNHTADNVDGNKYIWKIDADNKDNVDVAIQIDLTKNKNEKPKQDKKVIGTFKIVIGILIGGTIVILLIGINKAKNEAM